MSTLLALGSLARNSEIIAMQSCGISIARLSRPLLLTAFAISLMTLLMTEFVIPVSYQKMKYVEDVLIGRKSNRTVFRENNIWYREQGYILQARVFDPATTTLRGVTVWQRGAAILPVRRIDAAEAHHTATGWNLKQVNIRDFTGSGGQRTTPRPSLSLPLHLQESDLKVVDRNADSMGFLKLRAYSRTLREAGYDATRYVAQMHGRVSIAFASFIMAIIGIPFAHKGSRSGGAAVGIGISLVIGFLYYLINSIVLSFGQTGVVSPLIAAWSANFIFAMTAIWLTMTVNR
jgi:lipopolysaccharide export system permease protein